MSDNGTEFKNRVIDEFLTKKGVHHTTIPPYLPRANPVVRVNCTFKTMIVSFVEESHQRWVEHLHELVFAYNTAKHSSTGLSPALLNYGRQPAPLSNVQREQLITTAEEQQEEAVKRWAEHVQKLTELHTRAAQKSSDEQEGQARYFNAHRREAPFREGDLVWKRNKILSSAAQGIAAKLAPKFAGRYKISKVLGDSTYKLMDEDGNVMSPLHAEQIKSYVPEDNRNVHDPEGQPGLEPQPPRDAEEGIDGGESACVSDLARASVSGQELAPAEIVEPLGKRARGRPRKTVCIVRCPIILAHAPLSSGSATSKRNPGRPKRSRRRRSRDVRPVKRDRDRNERADFVD